MGNPADKGWRRITELSFRVRQGANVVEGKIRILKSFDFSFAQEIVSPVAKSRIFSSELHRHYAACHRAGFSRSAQAPSIATGNHEN